jgi:hypothetical protein
MITDALARLSGTNAFPPVAQALTSGTIYSTYCFDTQSPTNVSGGTTTTQIRDLGEGEDLYVSMTVGTAFSGGTNVLAEVVLGDDTSFTNTVVIGTMGTIVTASLTAGANFVARVNPRLGALGSTYRYLGVKYTISGTYSAGAVFADVVTDIYDSKKFYGSGFVVA